ncbi:MAG TPA: S41 family peptidase [Verrucomicrobiales bacterium]|nr:S41 family peptidase [Verrucomicrobiales bacterium]
MRFHSLALWCCCAALARAGEPPALTQTEMQPVLRALQTQYAQPEAVGFEALNRAAIAGLLKDHPDTIELVTVPDAVPPPVPLSSGLLTPQIACVRPGSFRQEDIAPLKEALAKLAASEVSTVILDLRVPAPDGDPAAAAAFAALFLPKETPLFTLATPLKTSEEPVWTRELVVLADRDTCNTAEVLAAVLAAKHRGFLIGSATRGRTAVINALPVRKMEGGNLVLRYAAKRAVFAEGSDPFGKGITPDMAAPEDKEAKRAVFARQAKEGFTAGVFHAPRPRNNEASLVARTSPELPERIARTAGKPSSYDDLLTDRPLQLAVDILTAKQILEPVEKK